MGKAGTGLAVRMSRMTCLWHLELCPGVQRDADIVNAIFGTCTTGSALRPSRFNRCSACQNLIVLVPILAALLLTQLPADGRRKAVADGPRARAPAVRVGDVDGARPAGAAMWRVDKWMEDLSPVPLSVIAFQINENFQILE